MTEVDLKAVDPRMLRICNRHPQGSTIARPGEVFVCPLCRRQWAYGEKGQQRMKYDTRGIV